MIVIPVPSALIVTLGALVWLGFTGLVQGLALYQLKRKYYLASLLSQTIVVIMLVYGATIFRIIAFKVVP